MCLSVSVLGTVRGRSLVKQDVSLCADGVVKKKRRKAGSRGSNFTEGWVEFPDKRIAKRVASALHNTPMGNKKHHRFHSDLWSMKVGGLVWCWVCPGPVCSLVVVHAQCRCVTVCSFVYCVNVFNSLFMCNSVLMCVTVRDGKNN